MSLFPIRGQKICADYAKTFKKSLLKRPLFPKTSYTSSVIPGIMIPKLQVGETEYGKQADEKTEGLTPIVD